MSAEQKSKEQQQEVKKRVEMLIRYFRENGNVEAAFVQDLENRLRRIRESMRMQMPEPC